jgi:hypothetical protein
MAFAPLFFGGGGGGGGGSVSEYIRSDINDTGPFTLESDDYTSQDIGIVWERPNRSLDIAIVEDSEVTKTNTSIQFMLPVAVASVARQLRYAIRSNNQVLASGFWRVRYRPGPDQE